MLQTNPPPTPSLFHYPIRTLENHRVKLVPFDPPRHLECFFRQSQFHPELYSHMRQGPFTALADLQAEFYSNADSILSFSNPAFFAYAIIDKTKPPSPEDPDGELAGTVSYTQTSPIHRSTEIGFIVILPAYQQKGLAAIAVALELQYAMSPDSGDSAGLGLRRAVWHTSTTNTASARLAEKLGFRKVGTIKWHWRFPLGQLKGKVGNGRGITPGDDVNDLWRDTMAYTLDWEDWANGAETHVKKILDG